MSVSFTQYADDQSVRHVLGLSGGKDSAALAIYIQQRYPGIHEKIEYFFSDTGAELPEVHQFLYLDMLLTYQEIDALQIRVLNYLKCINFLIS